MPDGGIGEAMLISSLIGGGASVAGAAIGSHAAGKAADTQAASADKALALEREMYQQAQQNYAPYLALGSSTLPKLLSLAGSSTPNLGLPGNVANPYGSGTPSWASAFASPKSVGYGQTPAAASAGMVRMQAPTGEVQMVPASKRAMYEARGARAL